jgi:hypothetical protein
MPIFASPQDVTGQTLLDWPVFQHLADCPRTTSSSEANVYSCGAGDGSINQTTVVRLPKGVNL